MKTKLFVFVLTIVLVVIGWRLINRNKSEPLANELLEQFIHSASFEALALNPVPISNSDKLGSNTDTLLRYPILGRVKIDEQNLRQELVSAISEDIANANHLPAACILEPRHGIRCIDGSNSILLAICYRCGDVVLERNGKENYYLIKMDGTLLSPASKRLFEKIFRKAGIQTDTK